MEELLNLISFSWLILRHVYQTIRLLLCVLALMLLGPLILLYMYDAGLYAWRLVITRKSQVNENSDQCETFLDLLGSDTDTIAVTVETAFDSDSDTTSNGDEIDDVSIRKQDSSSTLAQNEPRVLPFAGSYTRLTDLIAVTYSTGSDSGRMDNYEHEVKLISSTA